MRDTAPKPAASVASALLGVAVALLGLSILQSGQRVALQWSAVSAALAVCGVTWMIAGAAMVIGGIWVTGSLGRYRIPLWAGALGSVTADASVVIGVLSYVVPCSGPS